MYGLQNTIIKKTSFKKISIEVYLTNQIKNMAKNKKRLIFVIQSFEQPRILKKIIEKSEEFDQIDVYGFNRKIHAVNNYSVLDSYSNINYKIVASLEDKKYSNRIFAYIKLFLILLTKYGFSKKHMYVVGIDIRMICSFLINKKIEYVISDIMWLYLPKRKRDFLEKIDTRMAKNSYKVLFTSRGFYDAYYKSYVSEEQLVITENKLATYNKVKPLESLKLDTVRIAYIGAFRYTSIIKNLLKVVVENPNFMLNIYGDGSSEIVDYMKSHAKEYKNITYNGAFKNPDDLEYIYAQNNVNFVVYNNTLFNEMVAMPNKYYESGYFNMPIICATNTYVGERVLENGMGWVSGINYTDISAFFKNLKIEDIKDCHERIKKIDKNNFEC